MEVRALRAAMEQPPAPRVQLSMGRLQLQEQRINTLVRRMDEMRDRRTAMELELASKQREIADLEESLRREGMQPEARAKGLRTEASQILQRLQGLQSEEAALGQEIAAKPDAGRRSINGSRSSTGPSPGNSASSRLIDSIRGRWARLASPSLQHRP